MSKPRLPWAMALALLCLGPAPAQAASKTLHVASKAFTESVILAELATQIERSAGIAAEHSAGLGGTRLVWNALLDGSIDVYPEYTGTLLDEVLDGASTRPPGELGSAWLAQALAAHGVGMTAPLGFNNVRHRPHRAACPRCNGATACPRATSRGSITL